MINDPTKVNFKLSKKSTEQVDQLKQLKQAFLDAADAKLHLENTNMTGSDEYLIAVAKYIKAAAEIKSAFESSDLSNSGASWINMDGLGVLDDAEKVLTNFLSTNESLINKIKFLAKPYDALKEKMQEYVTLQNALNNSSDLTGDEEDAIYDKVDALEEFLISLDKVGTKKKDIKQILGDLAFGGLNRVNALESMSDLLGVEIPAAAKKAEDALKSLGRNSTVTDSSHSDDSDNKDDVIEDVQKTIHAIEYGKQQLVKAWKDYYKAVQKAKNDGIDLASGDKSHKMSVIEDSIQNMLDDFDTKAVKLDNLGIKWNLDLSEYIVDGDIGLDDIEAEIDKLFSQHEISFGASLETMQAKMVEAAEGGAQDLAGAMDKVDEKTNNALASFQQLVNYISQSGVNPSRFFGKLEQGAQNVDGELKNILESLNLIDASGKVKFDSISSGYTNKGGFVSDQYAVIARKITGDNGNDYWGKSQELQSKLLAAQQAGAQVGVIFDLIKDEANGLFYEIQNTVAGKAAFDVDNGTINMDVLGATEEQLSNLVHTMQALANNGLFIDFGGSNILYDKNKGFSIIDLGLIGGKGHTVSQQNTLQENVDRFIEEYLWYAPDNMHSKIQNTLADSLYDMAQNIDPSVINKINPNKQKAQGQAISQSVASGLNTEENAHQQNTDAIEAENAALKEQIDLKKKAQSMKWKDFAMDSSLSSVKSAAGLYTLGDMEHFWKEANYEKEVDFHELSQKEIDSILAKYGKVVPGGGDLDDLIKAKGAYGIAEAWYDDADFSAKTKMENMILEDAELRNIAMNKLYSLYKDATHDVISFSDFINKTITVWRGDQTNIGEGPSVFNTDELLAFSFKKQIAQGFAGPNGTVVPTTIIPKNTIGSLSTIDWHDHEAEALISSNYFPEHDLYLNNNYKNFEDYYNQQSKAVKNGIDKYLVQVEKNRVADLLGESVAELIDDSLLDGNFIQQFKHGIVPDSIKGGQGTSSNAFSNIYNQADEMQKKMMAYYASLASMNFGNYDFPKEIGITGIIGALTSDATGVKNHINKLTGEHQYNIFGQTIQNVAAETEAHKANTQEIQEEVQAQQQLNNEKLSLSAVMDKLADSFHSANLMDEQNKLGALYHELSNVGYTEKNSPDVFKDGSYISGLTGEVQDLSEIGDLIAVLEQAYNYNLDYVKNYLDQVIDNVFAQPETLNAFDTEKLLGENLNVKDKITDAAGNVDANHFSDIYELYKYVNYVGQTIKNASDAIPHGLVQDALTGELIEISEIISIIDKLEQKYGDNFDYVKEHLQNVYGNLSSQQPQGALDTVVEDIVPVDGDTSASNIVLLDQQACAEQYKKALHELSMAYNTSLTNAEQDMVKQIQDHVEYVQMDVEDYEPALADGKYIGGYNDIVKYDSLLNTIGEYEHKYGLYLEKTITYLKTVFAQYEQKMDAKVWEFDEPFDVFDTDMSDGATSGLTELGNDAETSAGQIDSTLNSFKALVDYISGMQMNPGSFFDILESDAKYAEASLKSILQSLNLIDASGNAKFDSIQSGYTNQGGFVSDQYAVVARNIIGPKGQEYLKKSKNLQSKLENAYQAGAQVGKIIDIIEDTSNNLFYEIQNTVPGTAAFSHHKQNINSDVINASYEQLNNFVHTLQALADNDLFVDWGGDNVLYDKDKGFSIIDFCLGGNKPYTVSSQNTLQENLDRFVKEYLKFSPSNMIPDFQHGIADVMYEIASGIDPSVVNPNGTTKSVASSGSASKSVISSTNAESAAHENNTAAIDAEAAAMEALIQLKEKAQNMKWKEFAKDESLDDLKKTAGFTSISQLEKFWKQSRYDKDIDYHEISKNEAEQIFRAKLTPGLAKQWYGPQKFPVKDQLENEILQDDEVRNAALNYLYYLYQNHLPKQFKNPNVNSFKDFLDTEFEIFRGDNAPLIYGDESKLSFTFNPNKTSGFDDQTGTVKMKPKNTIGNAGSTYYSEVEVFGMPASDTSWFKQTNESFMDYYTKQSDEMKGEIDAGLVNLEKRRIQDLLDQDVFNLAQAVGHDHDFKKKILPQFQDGIIPDFIETLGDGSVFDDFANIYNGLAEVDKKFVAYYSTLEALSNSLPQQFTAFGSKEYSKDIVGKDANLFNAVLNDPKGVQEYVSQLTGESKFGILGRNAKNIDLEANMHKINTKVIKEEQQAQEDLNQTKQKAQVVYSKEDIDKKFKAADEEMDQSWYQSPSVSQQEKEADHLWDEIIAVQKTYENNPEMLDKGEYIGSNKEAASYSDLISAVSDYENAYSESLSKVWDYLQATFKSHIDSMNNLAANIADNDDLSVADYDAVDMKEKYAKADKQLHDLYLATFDSNKEEDLLNLKGFLYTLDGGDSLYDDQGNKLNAEEQYAQISNLIFDYENKYHEKLTDVWNYIDSYFKKNRPR